MVKHLCDICQGRYSTVSEAEACEARGILGPLFEPGLTLIREDTETQGVYENLMIILVKEKNKGHDRMYRVGSTTFAPPDDPSNFLNHWGWGKYTGTDLQTRIEEGKLRIPTSEEFSYIERGLVFWRGEVERNIRDSLHYPLVTDIRTEILPVLDRYKLELHLRLPQ